MPLARVSLPRRMHDGDALRPSVRDKVRVTMGREHIPAEIRRAVLCEAGHRCSIPTCRYPEVEIHHIVPWELRKSHDFENLIALCANCHGRADAGEIDRKSLLIYKSRLSAAIGVGQTQAVAASGDTAILSEVRVGTPGYEFQFEYPTFREPDLAPVTVELEAWANQLLQEHRCEHTLDEVSTSEIMGGPNELSGAFEIARSDATVLSIKFRLIRYRTGAAHSTGATITKTYVRNPLYRLELRNLFAPKSDFLNALSRISHERLSQGENRDEEWVLRGTAPDLKHFRAFNVTKKGIVLTFDEYQVDCFAAGPQIVEIPAAELRSLLNAHLPRFWWPEKI
jgi:hypothetical protein